MPGTAMPECGGNRRGIGMVTFRRFQAYRERLRVRPQGLLELAEAADGVSEKTVRRDLTVLRNEWEWPIQYCASDRRWHANGELPLPVLSLSPAEAMALLVTEPALRAYGSSSFGPALQSALRKIIASLDAPVSPERPAVDFELQTVRELDPSLFEEFSRAVQRRERLEMTYRNPATRETKKRLIDPYRLEAYEGGWYVTAFDHTRGEPRDFAISCHRVLNLRHTGESFAPDPSFDPDTYRSGSFGIFKGGEPQVVDLLFAPSQEIYQMERIPRAGETRQRLESGGLRVTFEAPLSTGVLRWVLQYGSEVEVLAPPELRKQVQEEARKILAQDGGSAGPAGEERK